MLAIVLALASEIANADVSSTAPQPLPPVRYDQPKLDPAKVALARSVAARLLPAGWTAEWLKESFGLVGVVHRHLMIPVERLAKERGAKLPQEGINGPPVVRVRLLQIIDPASIQRVSAIHSAIEKMTVEIAGAREPQFREAMALAFGRRLGVGDLQSLDRFLATSAGRAFARANRIVWQDPGVLAAQQSIDRAIEEADADMARHIAEATVSLPKIKAWADLTDAEREEVAKLLKLNSSEPNK